VIQIEDSDDNMPTYPTEKRTTQEHELMTEVKAIRHDLGAVLSLSNEMKLPPGLFKQLKDTSSVTFASHHPSVPLSSLLGVVRTSQDVKPVWMAGLVERMKGPRAVLCAEPKGPIQRRAAYMVRMTF